MFESARRWLKNNGVDLSSLNMKDLTTRYKQLSERKESLKEAYISSNNEYKDLVNMDKSIHDFFNTPEQPIPFKIKEHSKSYPCL